MTMSHPCNLYDETTLEVLRELEIGLGFRANMQMSNRSVYEYPREDHANIIKELRGS